MLSVIISLLRVSNPVNPVNPVNHNKVLRYFYCFAVNVNNDSQDYEDSHDFGSSAENRMAVLKEAEQYGAVLRVLRIAEHCGAFL